MSTSINITLDQLDDKQRLAVERALDMSKRIVAITGEAGTGKTTIIRFVYQALSDAGYNPVIVAPTGKAARRLKEATGFPAKTVHMLLEYTAPRDINPKTGKPFGDSYPRRTRAEPIEHDIVLADEYAMINQELHRNLIDAMPPGCRLIAVGDISQLPPIETNQIIAAKPAVFKVMLEKFDGIHLDRVHRQQGDSGILSNAQRILNGTAPKNLPDFELCVTDQPVDAVMERLTKADFTALNNQIITPSNVSWIGTTKLNAALQMVLMPGDRPTIQLPRRTYNGKTLFPPLHVGVGDKVIITKNHYDLECNDGSRGVFNGEVGKVIEITDMSEVVVDFEDRIVSIPPAMQISIGNKIVVIEPQMDLFLAYAVTTHKTQGSEYQHVMYVINKAIHIMLNRKNMYTAISRARSAVTLITDMRALSLSIMNKEPKVFSK
jgi:exodeoxyribonuclease V alpha subunit